MSKLQFKGTPGPWGAHASTYSHEKDNGKYSLKTEGIDISIVEDEGYTMLANIIYKNDNPKLIKRREHHEVNTYAGKEVAWHDARLIAAAPDLLQALINALPHLDNTDEARAAIAKALNVSYDDTYTS